MYEFTSTIIQTKNTMYQFQTLQFVDEDVTLNMTTSDPPQCIHLRSKR